VRHLLDAHTLIWALDDPSRLGTKARAVLENPANELTVSVGTIWELSIKTGLRKLSLSLPYRQWVERALADLGMAVSPSRSSSPKSRWLCRSTTGILLTGSLWLNVWLRPFRS
jgi:PIN domain nuclease of toxin-antitoxin system